MSLPSDRNPRMPLSADVELVRGTLARDPESLARFIERMKCVPAMLAVRNSRSGGVLSEAELEDLSQDVVVAVWRKLDRFDGRARLETWVYQFCYLEFLRRCRTLRSRPRLLDDLAVAEEPEAEVVPGTLDYEQLYRSFDELGPAEADVLRLKHFEDLTFDEVGARLGVSPNTAKTRYYRALDKLRRRLVKSRRQPSPGEAS